MATPKPRPHDEYTIGWVCALPKEKTAAKAMLDDIHPAVQKPLNDPNNYTLGSIGQHNVVIACLPKGQLGTNSAATVATWMVSTFPRIKFGLMVGIGGGVPPKVRLGDVVVSTPVGQFPGVVQWDMGKAKENGSFERTGSLNNPPTSLLTALSNLESDHEMVGSKIPEYLEALRKKWPRLVSKYLRSDSLIDVLFKADYDHVNKSTTDDEDEGDEEENCRFCDKTRIVKRKPREARVHYGLIASGNQVIKDAIFRNKLNKDLGGQVLCIEMEAAGLMNNFPCVVIRGICDYADSHKNKDWQEHAAAMAAALAKELLQYVLPDDVEREPSVKDMLNHVYNMVSKVGADVAQIVSSIERDEDLKIFDWLTPRDFSRQQNKYIRTHQEGTGQWLLDSDKFMTWVRTDKQTLFCPGMPGAGKTILTAIVVDHLTSRFAHDPSVGIAYIYFNFWQQEDQKEEDLFASLLKQLVRGQSPVPASVKDVYDHHKGKGTRPSSDKILRVLKSVIRVSYKRVFIIIDALDECQASDNCRMRFIEGLLGLQQCGASIFATSRSIPEVMDKFDDSTRLEIRASDDDICRYVGAQISQGESTTLRNMQAEASTGIMKAADGMFLLAKLDLDSLLDAKLPRDIRTRLKNLPKGSKAYSHAYEGIMKRIEHQGPESVKFAKTVVSWITCAKRPLTIPELQHALAVEIGGSKFDQRDLPQVQDLISVCAGLVTVEEGSGIIRLFHYTAQEYFEQTQKQWFPDAGDDITRACVTYLSFDDFEAGSCPTDAEFEERLRSYQLYDYAARKWGHHARETTSLDPLVLDFLQCQSKVEASSQALFAVKESGKPHYSQNVPKQMIGLHLAAYFGIEKAVRIPLALHGWDPEDGYNRTPLSWAAENGHEVVVRLLLSKGADPKATDHSGLTPLSWATKGGHEAIVRLLNTYINAESANTDGQMPLPSTVGHSLSIGGADLEETRAKDRSKDQSEIAKLPPAKTDITRGQIEAGFLRILQGHGREVYSVAFSANSRYLASGSWDKTIKIWDIITGKVQQTLQGHGGYVWSVAFSADGRYLASGSQDNTIKIWDVITGKEQQTLQGHSSFVFSVAFSADSRYLASGSYDKTIKIWDIITGKEQQTLQGHSDSIWSVAFSADSRYLASGSWDKTIKIWDIITSKARQTLQGHSGYVWSVAFSADGYYLASGSVDTTIKIWDATTGKEQQTLQGHNDPITSVAFSADSRYLASGSWDMAIKIWDITTGKAREIFQGHSGYVWSVAFSADGYYLASGLGDTTIMIWDIITGKEQ
ncbi:hypothetical protein THAR02_00191 [Trichoderma harzianum]|uniref:Mitochondrial division protein 1 n=1 Tax=Trichoderma harzianum TaxID=5544 RepID=A0A0F9XT30_TRIHA|nr:hypothetical protein THAR02_00191 [Trichoderma harzianum]